MVLKNLTFSASNGPPAPPRPSPAVDGKKKRPRADEFHLRGRHPVVSDSPAKGHPDHSSGPRPNVPGSPPGALSHQLPSALLSPQAPLGEEAVVESIETQPERTLAEETVDADAVILDPKDSERQYWYDPIIRVQREIWRPGDGDGEKAADYYEKPGPKAPLETRWRLYQSRTGAGLVQRDVNEPPKNVILDDRAAYECFASNMPRQYLGQHWSHEFSNAGQLRARRPHRGRGAIRDPNGAGDQKYHSTTIGSKGDRYFFTGEKDYKPIVYQTDDPKLAVDIFKPPQRPIPLKTELASNKHGHNQFTPRNEMVRYGAPHKGSSWLRYSSRVNPFLTREKTPPLRSHGGMSTLYARNPAAYMPSMHTHQLTSAYRDATESEEEEEPMQVESDEERPAKRQKFRSLGTDDDPEKEEIAQMGFGGGGNHSSRSSTTRPTPFLEFSDDEAEDAPPQPMKPVEHPPLLAETSDKHQIADEQTSRPASPEVVVRDTPIATGHQDSGSYASTLEAELAQAKKTIEQQRGQISALEKAHAPAQSGTLEQEGEDPEEKVEALGNGDE
ncbi:uncharacterized protein LTR77_001089 [Saxophila tyrrhenica]|uniref:Uncharacterized protein n=1 Tax=Saxophila tyrrhenica TaxID=1690608 RepID=A0AAV9PMR3_9PEZI|nr:hypothetical protein LTR77_001089 [Saxophila tyrrhenica]